jgi:hypothetical protein
VLSWLPLEDLAAPPLPLSLFAVAWGSFKFIHVELLRKPFETSGGIATGFLQRKAGIGSNESFRKVDDGFHRVDLP